MSKVKIFAVMLVCGMCCLWSVNNSWAKDYTLNVVNNLSSTGDVKNVDSSCYPVTLSVHSPSPVKNFSIANPLKDGNSHTFDVTISHCSRMQIEAKCHWYRLNTNGIYGGTWLDTSASANFDCVSGTVKIVIENGQLGVKAP